MPEKGLDGQQIDVYLPSITDFKKRETNLMRGCLVVNIVSTTGVGKRLF